MRAPPYESEVAEIVAQSMDNYLLFNQVLKAQIVPTERVHEVGLYRNRRLFGHDKGSPQYYSVPVPVMYTMPLCCTGASHTFSYTVLSNQSRLRIPT